MTCSGKWGGMEGAGVMKFACSSRFSSRRTKLPRDMIVLIKRIHECLVESD
jgi:hypothetical protein